MIDSHSKLPLRAPCDVTSYTSCAQATRQQCTTCTQNCPYTAPFLHTQRQSRRKTHVSALDDDDEIPSDRFGAAAVALLLWNARRHLRRRRRRNNRSRMQSVRLLLDATLSAADCIAIRQDVSCSSAHATAMPTTDLFSHLFRANCGKRKSEPRFFLPPPTHPNACLHPFLHGRLSGICIFRSRQRRRRRRRRGGGGGRRRPETSSKFRMCKRGRPCCWRARRQ